MDHQNLSEHVLCMVLYLIELGLENSSEQESDEEVSVTFLYLSACYVYSVFSILEYNTIFKSFGCCCFLLLSCFTLESRAMFPLIFVLTLQGS